MNLIKAIDERHKKNIIPFHVGDTVRLSVKVIEGDKERIQPFEGIIIACRGSGTREMFTVRKVSFGVGVERIFPLLSPSIDKIDVLKKGSVRRAKLYYLRGKKGKAAKIKEKEKGLKETILSDSET